MTFSALALDVSMVPIPEIAGAEVKKFPWLRLARI
jgi:hypothetical protein